MATSSILENVKITDPKEIDDFVQALEQSEGEAKIDASAPSYEFVTDKESIMKILQKRYLKNG